MLNLHAKPYYLNNNQIKIIEKMVANMSQAAKIGQLFFVIGQDENAVNLEAFVNKYQPGGMMYRPDKAAKIQHELATAQINSKIPLFFAANLESGGNGLITEGTWFGTPLQMAATDDPKSAYELGSVSGNEAHQVGANMSFAPIVDIDKNFKNPIMNTRTFGSNKNRIIKMVDAQLKGLEENNIIPVVKHFPGDGVDERDQHLLSSINSLSSEDWMESYGQIYHHLIEEGISTVMVAHIMQPAWERKLQPGIEDKNLRPATSSKLLVNGLLRGVLHFNGLAITDATPMIGYNAALDRKDLLPATINAGIDMILFNKNIDEDYQFVTNAVENGTISQERLNEAVKRILATKLAQKIMDENGQATFIAKENFSINYAEHKKMAEEVAKKSITLVKDRDHLLPMTPKRYPRIRLVVLGDSDDGGFKEGGHVTNLFKERLEMAGFKVTVFDHKHLDFHEVFEEGIADIKQKFDLALYVANVETASNQTTTRLDWIHLMAADSPWFMKSIPTIFVSTANPYHLYDIPSVSTFINAYTGNVPSVEAVIRKLQGHEAFEGKSPVDPFCGDFTAKL
ncbi:glycoside hydrolase family 3 protein [Limosilactobacillus mucosae]|uniref:glycoside hydrolase family 3 protein n=1 Tax=Limosilactobacillus mucosae TaxID=97478 RepID=UPI0025A3F8D0|nr:glycoside hydrolase family 3 N-terminal domain-containing protein [Limosilactobacillus mucosae]MDM8220645.1 glycoside hydrolase family 3 N-terminal domain-containing protein [Limosilactobacillus mucosae]MDM8315277.1 glycoside hydrolase family 3 N-terminal domain-containing protein [Limosilactobacillus mucosae]